MFLFINSKSASSRVPKRVLEIDPMALSSPRRILVCVIVFNLRTDRSRFFIRAVITSGDSYAVIFFTMIDNWQVVFVRFLHIDIGH